MSAESNTPSTDPFGIVKAHQISTLNHNIEMLTDRLESLEARMENKLVSRVEMYMTFLVFVLVATVVSLLFYIFSTGGMRG